MGEKNLKLLPEKWQNEKIEQLARNEQERMILRRERIRIVLMVVESANFLHADAAEKIEIFSHGEKIIIRVSGVDPGILTNIKHVLDRLPQMSAQVQRGILFVDIGLDPCEEIEYEINEV